MASSGPNFPSTGADDATVGSAGWTNPGNITADDSTFAASFIGAPMQTHYLMATGFGFAIPASAIINGILAEVKLFTGSGTTTIDASVKAVKGGVISGTDQSTGTSLPTSLAYVSYGGATNLWGLSWTPANINASTFGIVYSCLDNTTNSSVGSDAIRITVTYSLINKVRTRLTQAVQRAAVR